MKIGGILSTLCLAKLAGSVRIEFMESMDGFTIMAPISMAETTIDFFRGDQDEDEDDQISGVPANVSLDPDADKIPTIDDLLILDMTTDY